MPLPNDERVVALANELLQIFDKLFGLHPGFRAAHARGQMLTGTFTPSHEAAMLEQCAALLTRKHARERAFFKLHRHPHAAG